MDNDKLITVLLVIAIIVSVSGIAISLNKLRIIRLAEITGLATTDTGKANVSIQSLTSISVVDRVINFGACTPGSSGWINKTSNCSFAGDATCDDNCTGGDYPDTVNISNDGNVNIEVNFTVDAVAGTSFIGGTEPGVWYISRNNTARGGCMNFSSKYCTGTGGGCGCTTNITGNCTWTNQYPDGVEDWVNITDTSKRFKGCLNLTYGLNKNEFIIYAKIRLPYDAPATGIEQKVNMTFQSTQAT